MAEKIKANVIYKIVAADEAIVIDKVIAVDEAILIGNVIVVNKAILDNAANDAIVAYKDDSDNEANGVLDNWQSTCWAWNAWWCQQGSLIQWARVVTGKAVDVLNEFVVA